MHKKRQSNQQCLFAPLGPTCVNAARKMLLRFTPGGMIVCVCLCVAFYVTQSMTQFFFLNFFGEKNFAF